MGGLFILVMAIIATFTFLFISIKYGFKIAKEKHDEEELAGVLFIFYFGGLLLSVFIFDYFIPKPPIENRIFYILAFSSIWGFLYLKFGDYLNK